MGFQEEQMPYKEIALEFTEFLVLKNYKKSWNMLHSSLKEKYTVNDLEKEMDTMIDYFFTKNNIWVATEFVKDEGAIDNGCIYVPIEEEGNSEAVTVDIDYENSNLCITNIEWGRP